MQKLWVDLEQFGIELKKIQTPDGNMFPLLIVTDVEKYKASGAMPLDQLRSPTNGTGFQKLSGERKGRNPNTPLFMLTKSFKEGVHEFNIKSGLSKLLNIPETQVKQFYVQKEESEFIENGTYADFQKLNQVLDQNLQRFYSSILYVVKEKAPVENLIDLAQKFVEQQHGLFPKNTVENIPFSTLDSFGLNSSIVDKAFLNPDDALQQGYGLNSLSSISLQGNRSVLPISVNSDNSINIILDPDQYSAFAYTTYNWQKNFPLIEDYSAMLSLREASRAILNTRTKDISNAQEMEHHIEKISLAFQNFNASQAAIKLHKPLKFNQNGVYTFLAKNKDNEWRFIEKEGFKKTDKPLNWENYQRAIQKIADHNNVVSGALQLKVLHNEELDFALSKVFKNQESLFKKYVKVVDNGLPVENKIVINEIGKKVNSNHFDANTRKFQRDVGQQLKNEQVLSTISYFSQVPDAGNIKNTLGQYVDGFSLASTVVEVEDPKYTQDILEIYERNKSDSPKAQTIEDTLSGTDATLAAERKSAYAATLTSSNEARLINLPRGLSAKIDQNYDEANNVFKVMQRINLSDIPYWENSLAEARELKTQALSLTSATLEHNLLYAVNKLGTAQAIIDAAKMPENEGQVLSAADTTIAEIAEHLEKERFKANILQYQFAKLTADVDSPTYGNLVFNHDAEGKFIPFETKNDYDVACQLVGNNFTKINAENGSLVLDNSEVRQQIDSFVESNYNGAKREVNNIFENMELLNTSAKAKLQFVDLEIEPVSVTHLPPDLNEKLFNAVVDNLNQGLADYSKTADQSALDNSIKNVSKMFFNIEQQSALPVTIGNTYLSRLMDRYSQANEGESKFISPLTGVELSDRSKLDVIKDLASIAFSNLRGVSAVVTPELRNSQIELSENLAHGYNKNEQKLDQIDIAQFQQKLAGEFSLLNLNEPISDATIANVRFGLNLQDPLTPYKIIKFDASIDHPEITKMLHASRFQDAKKEAFSLNQTNVIADRFGISNHDLNQIADIAQAIREGDDLTVKSLTSNLTKVELSTNDLLEMTSSLSPDVNSIGNRNYVFTTPSSDSITLNPIQGADLLNKAVLIHRMIDSDVSLLANPLIHQIDNLESYASIQNYLAIGHAEEHELSVVSNDNFSPKNAEKLASSMTDHALNQFNAVNGKGIDFTNNTAEQLVIATSIPLSNTDHLITRIVPTTWTENLNEIERNKTTINLTAIPSMRNEKGQLDRSQVESAISNHISMGDEKSGIRSSVISLDAMLNNPTQDKIITSDQQQILFEGGLFNLRQTQPSKLVNDTLTTVANFEVALTNMPSDLKESLSHALGNTDGPVNSEGLRLSMTKQKGIEIPQLSITATNDIVPKDSLIAQYMSVSQLANTLNVAGVSYDSNSGAFQLPNDIEKLEQLNKLHGNLLDSVGFNESTHKNNVVAAFSANQIESHAEFLKKFPSEKLTIGQIQETYAKVLVDGLHQANTGESKGKDLYLSFGKEAFLPQPIISTKQTVDSFAIDSSLSGHEAAKQFIDSLTITTNYLPKNAIVDQLQSVQIPNELISKDSLAIVRSNFIEQFAQKMNITAPTSQVSDAIDNAKLYYSNTDGNTTFTLAASAEKAIDLVYKGAKVLIDQVTVDSIEPEKNILGKLAELDDRSSEHLVSYAQNLAILPNGPSNAFDAVSVLAPFEDAADTLQKLEDQKALDIQNAVNQAPEIKTEFIEPLAHKYTPNAVLGMTGVEIKDSIHLDKIWPQVDISDHIQSQHQNLDTMILGRTIRNTLPKEPNVTDAANYTNQASSYVYFINAVHNAVSTAKTSEQLVDNVQKAVIKMNVYNVDYLNTNSAERDFSVEPFAKAAYLKNNEGVPLADALNQSLQSYKVVKSIENITKQLADKETLFGNEVSFVNYLNGGVLNAPTAQIDALNTALVSRMVENRNPESKDLSAFAVKSPNMIINMAVIANINAKSPSDFNEVKASESLKSKWGVDYTINPENKIFAKGFMDIADKALTQLHTAMGGDDSLDKKSMSLGGVSFGFGEFQKDYASNKISIGRPNQEVALPSVKYQWLQSMISKVEQQELKQMSQDDVRDYANMVNENQNFGLVAFVQDHGYKPKTEALTQLVNVHSYLKGDNSTQLNNAPAQLINQAAIVETQKDASFKRLTQSYNSYDDDMSRRTFFVENFAAQFVANMTSKQNEMFRKIESKMASISEHSQHANDLYDFKTLSDSLNKVTNIPLPTSKTEIDKYADKAKDTAIAKNEGYSKEDIILEIKNKLEKSSPIFTAAQDLLAAKASYKFIELMDKYSPENVKSSQDYTNELNRYFNLGESSDLSLTKYKSEFGNAVEKNHIQQDANSEYLTRLSPDEVTHSFLSRSLDNDLAIEIPINPTEKSVGLDSIVSLVQKLQTVADIPNQDAELTHKKANQLSYE